MAAGCIGEQRAEWFARRESERAAWGRALESQVPSAALADAGLPLRRDAGKKALAEWLRYPDISLTNLIPWLDDDLDADSELALELAEDAAYAPYLERQEGELRDLRASEAVVLAADFPFAQVPGLSNEMVERLAAARPATLAAAGRVRGITPAALAALLVFSRRRAA
jgi:tRNA uridine 5-carboxymethylaminomethyl modification enzyme